MSWFLGKVGITFYLMDYEDNKYTLGKKKYMYVSGFSSEKNRYGRAALSFYSIELFYR